MARSNEENNLQKSCVHWFDYVHAPNGHILFAVPNGGVRDAKEGKLLKAQGVRAGVPDLCLLTRRGVLFIEMKTPSGRVSPEQHEQHAKFLHCGYVVRVCRTFDEFSATVNDWILNDPKPF